MGISSLWKKPGNAYQDVIKLSGDLQDAQHEVDRLGHDLRAAQRLIAERDRQIETQAGVVATLRGVKDQLEAEIKRITGVANTHIDQVRAFEAHNQRLKFKVTELEAEVQRVTKQADLNHDAFRIASSKLSGIETILRGES